MDLATSQSMHELLMNTHSSTIKETMAIATPSVTDLELQLLEASKSGDLDVVNVGLIRSILSTRVTTLDSFQRILTSHPSLVNCRDAQGRNSTPLHFAAGYNRLQVVEYLLSMGADVTARDKGEAITLLTLVLILSLHCIFF